MQNHRGRNRRFAAIAQGIGVILLCCPCPTSALAPHAVSENSLSAMRSQAEAMRSSGEEGDRRLPVGEAVGSQSDVTLTVCPAAWTDENIGRFIAYGNWQGVEVALSESRALVQLQDLAKRRSGVPAGVARRDLAVKIQGILEMQSDPPRAFRAVKTRAAQVAAALELLELAPALKKGIEQNSPGEPVAAYLIAWAALQEDISGESEKYLLEKARQPALRSAAMTVLSKTASQRVLSLFLEMVEQAQGKPMQGMSDGDVAKFLKNFFEEQHWGIHRQARFRWAREIAPRLFQGLEAHYPRMQWEDKIALGDWANDFLDLLPEEYPLPPIALDMIMEEEAAGFEEAFAGLGIPRWDSEALMAEFRSHLAFLPLHKAIWKLGPAYARDLALLYKERKGIVVGHAGAVGNVILPEGLSKRAFQEAFWHAWAQFLSAKGVIADAPELPEIACRVGHQDRTPQPIQYWLVQNVLERWNRDVLAAVQKALHPYDLIPLMSQLAEGFPQKYGYLRAVLGERFFRGLHGLYLVQLIHNVAALYYEHNEMTLRLTTELAGLLMRGVAPAKAYRAVFETNYARENVFNPDVFVSDAARDLAAQLKGAGATEGAL